jgi:hypothetical protein
MECRKEEQKKETADAEQPIRTAINGTEPWIRIVKATQLE